MHEIEEARFAIGAPWRVAPGKLTPLTLTPCGGQLDGVVCDNGRLRFDTIGWFEVMLSVSWDPTATHGTRFVHSKIPAQQPLHSEAINASVSSP